MLDAHLRDQLKEYLKLLRHPIELQVSLGADDASVQLEQLVKEIASLSDQVTIVSTPLPRTPSFRIHNGKTSTTFAGVPLGHEFTSLVLALLHVGGHPPKITQEERSIIEQLPEMTVETFFSQSCHNCPDVVQAWNTIASINPSVHHTAIDGASFPEEVSRRDIMTVPQVFLDQQSFSHGRQTLSELVQALRSKTSIEEEKIHHEVDVVVVGGGPAGLTASMYLARKGVNVEVVSERWGGQVNDTQDIENYLSVPHTTGPKLVQDMLAHVDQYGVPKLQARAEKLEKTDHGFVLSTNKGQVSAKSVVLALGAKWRQLNVPGEERLLTKGVTFCPHCDGPLFKGQRVAVVGGGNSGVEAAIDLANVASHVTLLEYASKLRADAVLQQKLFSLPNVTVLTSAGVEEVLGKNKVQGLKYRSQLTDEVHQLELEGVFVQIGLLPATQWLEVDKTPQGEIKVNEKGQTSWEGVFAAGDATDHPYKQIATAVGDGSLAALSAFDHLIRHG